MTLEAFCCYLPQCDKVRTRVAKAARAAIGLSEAAVPPPEE